MEQDLLKYFKHPAFKSRLQRSAIKQILKSECGRLEKCPELLISDLSSRR